MAKRAPAPPPPPPSAAWAWAKLVVTLVVLAALAYGLKLAVAAVQDAITQGKDALNKKGVTLGKSGASIRTDKRAMTQEETEDRLQRGLMKGWKASTFEVPWLLQKTTNLGGSAHDKNKTEWEKTHGPKQHKSRVE
ncbi:hypothetical protein JCM10213_004597 [Rhodosporidiobolus nylandii]